MIGHLKQARRNLVVACGLLVGLSACQDCAGCGDRGRPLAVLHSMSVQDVTRDDAKTVGKWRAAEVEDEFRLGEGIRTGPKSEAGLTLADGNDLRMPGNTIVRFMTDADDQGGQRLEVEAGSAVLTANTAPLRLATRLGTAVIQTGGQVRVARGDTAVRYVVKVGHASFTSKMGTIEASAGETVEIGIGDAVLRRIGQRKVAAPDGQFGPAEGAAQDTAVQDGANLDDGSHGGDDKAQISYEPGGSHFNLKVPAGDSATVHSTKAPVLVGFVVGDKCPAEAVVQLGSRGTRYGSRGTVVVPVAAGRHRYKVRCLEHGRRRVIARGRIQVVRDPGTRKLPRRPPTSQVDADGRNYKVFYQNQPPTVVTRWPRAPKADHYGLLVDGKRQTVKKAEHAFSSGALSDGTHEIAFEAAGRRSRTTTVDIRFDNAASTASLSAPAERGFDAGQTISIQGVALPGWKVSAEGGTLVMLGGHRFQGQVTTTAEQPDVALRLWHPRLGTHYYLRRSAQSP